MNAPTSGTSPEVPPLPVERKPAGEDAAIQVMVRDLRRQLEEDYPKGHLTRRDAHPKHHGGLVRATLRVDDDCPLELRHGIFMPGRSYSAFLRFSNGNPTPKHDLKSDVRGLAVKLTAGVGRSLLGEFEHDMLLATGEAFFGSDAVDYKGFPAASRSPWKLLGFFLWPPNRLRLRAGWRLLQGRQRPASPLDPNYFSQVPYRLGPHCVKYLVRRRGAAPAGTVPWPLRSGVRTVVGYTLGLAGKVFTHLPWHDALRDALIRELGGDTVLLDLFVQRWPDLSNLPVWAIEDATRTWPVPFARVATIEIPPQTATEICALEAEAERRSFHPWRVTPEHQPLGGINRARLAVYSAMSQFRNDRNTQRPAS